MITFKVEIEREDDGHCPAAVLELPGVLAYGETQGAALSRVQALALRVVAEPFHWDERSVPACWPESSSARACGLKTCEPQLLRNKPPERTGFAGRSLPAVRHRDRRNR